MNDNRPADGLFQFQPRLMDWSGSDGSPFEVANVVSYCRMISIQECDLNLEGARALRDWLNKVMP